MGEESDAKLMYSIDGKSFQALSEIKELTLDIPDDEVDNLKDMFKGGKLSFSCNVNPLQFLGIIMDEPTLTRYARTLCNNWRRRHGLPMIRRATLRRLRRNKGYDEL